MGAFYSKSSKNNPWVWRDKMSCQPRWSRCLAVWLTGQWFDPCLSQQKMPKLPAIFYGLSDLLSGQVRNPPPSEDQLEARTVLYSISRSESGRNSLTCTWLTPFWYRGRDWPSYFWPWRSQSSLPTGSLSLKWQHARARLRQVPAGNLVRLSDHSWGLEGS